MATATYIPIATQTLGSAASSITFSSIPGTYTDLRLVLTCTASAAYTVTLRFNSDSGSNYSVTTLIGSGSAASSANQTSQTQMYGLGYVSGVSTTVPSMATYDIFSYAGATYKTVLMNGATDFNGSGDVENIVGLWRSTSAITSISIQLTSGNLSTGTIATLFGI